MIFVYSSIYIYITTESKKSTLPPSPKHQSSSSNPPTTASTHSVSVINRSRSILGKCMYIVLNDVFTIPLSECIETVYT